jgi:hypothetical protein
MPVPNRCYSTLTVYGNTALSESIRRIVEAVFGPCLHDDDLPDRDAIAGSPVAVVRIVTTEEPPTELISELSEKLPELSFVLNCMMPLRGCRRVYNYRGGQAENGGGDSSGGESVRQDYVQTTLEYSDHWAIEAVVAAATCTQEWTKACPRCLLERAQEHLDHHYSFVFGASRADCWARESGYEEDTAFRNYRTIEALLSQEEKQYLEEVSDDRKARVDSLLSQAKAERAAGLLLAGLRNFEVPVVAKFLDADDRAALVRLTEASQKVGPECYEALIEKMPEVEPF